MEANEALATAYVLKEQFRAISTFRTLGWAQWALKDWCGMAGASGLAPFKRLARGFMALSARVCGFVKHGLTAGLIEGFNNSICIATDLRGCLKNI